MPCDTIIKEGVSVWERASEIKRAIEKLETALASGEVTVVVGAEGSVAFQGWSQENRDGVTDLCAYRRLTLENSWALKNAVERAEALSGKEVNKEAVALGVHSHDGGKTWGRH